MQSLERLDSVKRPTYETSMLNVDVNNDDDVVLVSLNSYVSVLREVRFFIFATILTIYNFFQKIRINK